MKIRNKPLRAAILTGVFGAVIGMPVPLAAAPCMPCSPRAGQRNPCAASNPCRAKNPCAAGRVDPALVTRPIGTEPYKGDPSKGDPVALITEGRDLWNSKAISRNNSMSCSTCHQDGTTMLQPDFAKPYPHFVQMVAEGSGKESITLEEMVQFCMLKPMQTKTFPWDSRELAALTAYTSVLQRRFKPVSNAQNPCAAMNPCSAKNPCSAMKNPCAAKNPCAVRP